MSDYCKFAQVVLSLPHMERVDVDFDLGIEQDDSGRSDGPRTRLVLQTDNMLWRQLMMMKDLQPKLLGWFLCLKEFNFVARSKNDAHMLTNLDRP